MARTVVTQNGEIVNFDKLLVVCIEENDGFFELVGIYSDEKAIVLASFEDSKSAEQAKSDMIKWLGKEAFSTFEINESGD